MTRMNVDIERAWKAGWIGAGDCQADWRSPVQPPPYFRKEFDFSGGTAKAFVCGLGYFELWVNGKRAGDSVLDPVVSQYERHVRYLEFDLSPLLVSGRNTVGIVLGGGWYNCDTPDVWHFDKAPWRDYPKLIFELESEEKLLLKSDSSWKCTKNGPLRFSSLRTGEQYDARLEMPGWNVSGFDDSGWKNAAVVPGPGGIPVRQIQPSCRIVETFPCVKMTPGDGVTICDFGRSLSGNVRLKVRGPRGSSVRAVCSERVSKDGRAIDMSNINSCVVERLIQTYEYILAGKAGGETFEPQFSFSGFRYAELLISGGAELVSAEACVIRTGFDRIGSFECSDPLLNRLYECTMNSYTGNFVGIPSDCPHREKNGWTGDAMLASDTGLFSFDAASAYAEWMQDFVDVQRADGQLPGIVPSGGWGFNWGSGPCWDSAFILIPWNVYLYTGDFSIVERNYGAMKRYVDYLGTLAEQNIVSFGLGDWCPPDWKRMTSTSVTSTGYYYLDAVILAKCAKKLGKTDDAAALEKLASEIRDSFNRKFCNGDGTFAKGELTALGCALYTGLCPDSERARTAAKLDELVRAKQYTADFGILGAKYVPRVLADSGYAESAFRIFRQEKFPGWIHWIQQGATTLWENWDGTASRFHIMYGDCAAWFMQYAAGIVPDESAPGFSRLTLKPCFPEELDSVKAEYRTPHGIVRSGWKRSHGKTVFEAESPVPGILILPDGSRHPFEPGKVRTGI